MTRSAVAGAETTLPGQSSRQYCRLLKKPTLAAQCERLAQVAAREGQEVKTLAPLEFLEALLAAEVEERQGKAITRRVQEARLPRVKTLDEFDFGQSPLSASRALGRWERVELVCIDEPGYVPRADVGAELLFQLIADRAGKAAAVVTTNLPFSEWGQVFANPRLCKAVLDRVTDRAHILETGNASYRFRRTLAKKGTGS